MSTKSRPVLGAAILVTVLAGCGSTTEADQLALLEGGTVTIDVIDE